MLKAVGQGSPPFFHGEVVDSRDESGAPQGRGRCKLFKPSFGAGFGHPSAPLAFQVDAVPHGSRSVHVVAGAERNVSDSGSEAIKLEFLLDGQGMAGADIGIQGRAKLIKSFEVVPVSVGESQIGKMLEFSNPPALLDRRNKVHSFRQAKL